MICPQCKAEYRPGFTRCADCDVDLVEELRPDSASSRDPDGAAWPPEEIFEGEPLRVIWEGDDQQECVEVCGELQSQEIPYKLNESIAGRYLKMHVDRSYRVGVRAADYEKARKALGYISDEEEEAIKGAEESGALELPTQDDMPVRGFRGDWKPRGWHPEDATVKVWEMRAVQSESVVEMSLKENRINYRSEIDEEGRKKILVMPEDEGRAKEIVREIVDGRPPE